MGELTNSLRKTYTSLSSSKGRREHGLFMAQGEKCVNDTIESFEVNTVLANAKWIQEHKDLENMYDITPVKTIDLERISTLSNAPDVIAIYKIPEAEYPKLTGELVLALDTIQDPGNLGTIIRVSDWMGVTSILASKDTADVWSPKVVQASMGAVARVRVWYCDLLQTLKRQSGLPIYATALDGDNIYDADLADTGIILMGNEGKGVSKQLLELVNKHLFIPPYPEGRHTSESLNVAIATSITLAEFRRRANQR